MTDEGATVSRASVIDITVDDELSRLTLSGTARDVVTAADGTRSVLDEVRTRTVVGVSNGIVLELTVAPDSGAPTMHLVGIPSGSGFRRSVRHELDGYVRSTSALAQLLDDVPVVTVIAGSLLRRHPRRVERVGSNAAPPVDVCAGWARGGLLAVTTAATGSPPLGEGPVASPLHTVCEAFADDPPQGLASWAMRRARGIIRHRTDGSTGHHEVTAFFRDSRRTDDGVERVVHEYAVSATVDSTGTILRIAAEPRVLPAPECPAAAASAERLVGEPITAVRNHVSATFFGTSTCTHLNDALRGLGDLDQLCSAAIEDEGAKVRRGQL